MKKMAGDLRVFCLAFLEAHLTNQGSRLVAKTLMETWLQLKGSVWIYKTKTNENKLYLETGPVIESKRSKE